VHEELKYDPSQITDNAARTTMLRALCEGPTDHARAFARKTEQWYAELAAGRGKLRKRLLSADDSTFWAAWWELAYARLFSNLGCAVELEPNIDGQRPDLAISRSGERALVEVLMIGPSDRVRRDEERVAMVSAVLTERVEVPAGWLNIVLDESTRDPDDADLAQCVQKLDHFIADKDNVGQRVDLTTPTIRGWGRWFPGREPGHLFVGPSGRRIGDHDRWQRRLQQKLDKYDLTEPGTPLVIATGMGHWTLTTDGVVDALFGQEQVIVSIDKPDDVTTRRSGDGVLVPRSGGLPPSRVAGVSIASFRTASLEGDHCLVDVFYVHNPYPSLRLPDDWLYPFTEWQLMGENLVPVRPENLGQELR
jgi:hypothetical protein